MSNNIYYTTVASVFLVIAILHLIRAVKGWEAVIAGASIPIWFSWVAVALAGYLSIRGFQLRLRRRTG